MDGGAAADAGRAATGYRSECMIASFTGCVMIVKAAFAQVTAWLVV